ncbi:NitT/TauT family transport system ATP-binding protein [Gibbsiella quercinecans]|uniref:Nitrate ABC transporter ATP-binding protein n=2 Tax=Gibbsiella TaxID=929812 RepID=A0A250AWC2_9GAMM|nr:ABC transporter ATP-binding protein [Gibbsiella quercinecans]ATA18237.1 nitrate ABC transporter ATP-binding protein [Gibbsiella quercinecans]RLM06806.1 nitrate ABC transporter ATP-binding protein [Gibbsiella quercinecans]RLM09135.1 nitrate ABC transporter ATP-binding protein [Gibbsiella quercinecans]RLM12963.1 nitrate ABC transporter ATP-binding protein [Gibbsiella quercinecans]TCT92583.1 NitT/TauT family transport system ATP-binding protein [Gibbsiella quercinecans]
MSFVKFENVSLAYNSEQLAIKDINFSINENEFVALVGPSGCGKSTFMKLTSGLIAPSKGYVFVNKREVSGPQKCVGMAFQASNLLPWRTTLQNVMLPMEIVEPYRSTRRKKGREYEEQARALLKRVGLEGYEDKFPWELSGGMQQRASICRALIHKPRLLMLDEPFGALDAFTREELWCMVRDLWQEAPFTVVLVTHDLREAVFLADTVYVMSARPGRIIARREIEIPRPRDLQVAYTDAFSRYVLELREHISSQHHA